MLPEIAVQGWILPDSTRKYHYYHDSQTISLCGRYDIRPAQLDEAYDNNHSCADNCAACQRKRLQLEQHG